MAESNEEEKEKIQSKLASLESHFGKLRENSQKIISRLEEALKMALGYEGGCDQFEKWLQEVEQRKASMSPFTIASQPLKTQMQHLQVRVKGCTYRMTVLQEFTWDIMTLFIPLHTISH